MGGGQDSYPGEYEDLTPEEKKMLEENVARRKLAETKILPLIERVKHFIASAEKRRVTTKGREVALRAIDKAEELEKKLDKDGFFYIHFNYASFDDARTLVLGAYEFQTRYRRKKK